MLPEVLGADPNRNNDFSYSDDMEGLKCPFSAHIRRLNPRDALKDDLIAVNIHHILRRATNYGPPLPEGVLEDDGAQRGGVFLLIGAHIKRQFEFLQSQWVTDGDFIRHGTEQDPIIGNSQGDITFTIPKRPIRRRLHGLPHISLWPIVFQGKSKGIKQVIMYRSFLIQVAIIFFSCSYVTTSYLFSD
ncbi:MAG TPA: hypothetical protein VE572_04190 [Nitrososphaeraceae archaeon]|nr:hypothetical protein [Nitrososphaeraceae archaeon]